MISRADILARYDVRDGIIRNPGKFEGEPIYLPYFYEMMLEGCVDETLGDGETENTIDILKLTPSERAEFPEIDADSVAIALEHTEQGFVLCSELNQDELEALEASE